MKAVRAGLTLQEALVSIKKIGRKMNYSDRFGSRIVSEQFLFQRNIPVSSYFAFHVNAFKGWNSASASVTQPYFFF